MAKTKNIDEKIKEIRETILNREFKPLTKRVQIIYDGKQFNIRIPVLFAEKARIDMKKDDFEFKLEMPKDPSELPKLYGEVVEKENKTKRQRKSNN